MDLSNAIIKDKKSPKWTTEVVVQGNYGQGWEDVTSEETYSEGRKRLREYDDNESYPHRIIRRRIRNE